MYFSISKGKGGNPSLRLLKRLKQVSLINFQITCMKLA